MRVCVRVTLVPVPWPSSHAVPCVTAAALNRRAVQLQQLASLPACLACMHAWGVVLILLCMAVHAIGASCIRVGVCVYVLVYAGVCWDLRGTMAQMIMPIHSALCKQVLSSALGHDHVANPPAVQQLLLLRRVPAGGSTSLFIHQSRVQTALTTQCMGSDGKVMLADAHPAAAPLWSARAIGPPDPPRRLGGTWQPFAPADGNARNQMEPYMTWLTRYAWYRSVTGARHMRSLDAMPVLPS